MAGNVIRAPLAAIALTLLLASAASAQELSREARMAETIARVCLEGLQTPHALQAENFGDQFVLENVREGVTRMRQARGEPWVRLRLNVSSPGSCAATFSVSGLGDSRATAAQLAGLIARDPRLRSVSVSGANHAFAFVGADHDFDHERDAYVAYVFAGGYDMFVFIAAPTASGEAPQAQP